MIAESSKPSWEPTQPNSSPIPLDPSILMQTTAFILDHNRYHIVTEPALSVINPSEPSPTNTASTTLPGYTTDTPAPQSPVLVQNQTRHANEHLFAPTITVSTSQSTTLESVVEADDECN
ncbi:hypothetical protein QCA50_007996 [Cerrena zonata]|uniref:Uncharacterized protein n=1 Tax=Cerrena zonata TaxID=2478898 RepID=A0AAW0GEF6_9APHY